MGQSLADAAVRGTFGKSIEDQKREALETGDIAGLMDLNRQLFGGFTMMAKPGDGTDDDDDDDDGDDDDEDDDDEDDEDEDDKAKPDAKDRKITQLTGEAKKYRLRNRAHRNRIAELEAENAELKKGKAKPKGKADDDEDDDSSEELQSTKADNEKLARVNEDLLIRLEFMGNSKYAWKNPKAALRLLDLDDVEITEDGEVEGLDEAIDALAKSDPYLLKGKDEDDDEDDDDEDKKRRRRTGTPTGNQRKKGNPNRDKLVNKYPALRR